MAIPLVADLTGSQKSRWDRFRKTWHDDVAQGGKFLIVQDTDIKIVHLRLEKGGQLKRHDVAHPTASQCTQSTIHTILVHPLPHSASPAELSLRQSPFV